MSVSSSNSNCAFCKKPIETEKDIIWITHEDKNSKSHNLHRGHCLSHILSELLRRNKGNCIICSHKFSKLHSGDYTFKLNEDGFTFGKKGTSDEPKTEKDSNENKTWHSDDDDDVLRWYI